MHNCSTRLASSLSLDFTSTFALISHPPSTFLAASPQARDGRLLCLSTSSFSPLRIILCLNLLTKLLATNPLIERSCLQFGHLNYHFKHSSTAEDDRLASDSGATSLLVACGSGTAGPLSAPYALVEPALRYDTACALVRPEPLACAVSLPHWYRFSIKSNNGSVEPID
jgi:hypothetical protein